MTFEPDHWDHFADLEPLHLEEEEPDQAHPLVEGKEIDRTARKTF
jgi:hypothetical protein